LLPAANAREVRDELEIKALLGARHLGEARKILFGDR
jgi:hypothetical protein